MAQPIILTFCTCFQGGADDQLLNQYSVSVPCGIEINQEIYILNLFYIMLSRLEWVYAIGGTLLRVSVDCKPFSLPNWIVGRRLVMSVSVWNLVWYFCFFLLNSSTCIVYCLPTWLVAGQIQKTKTPFSFFILGTWVCYWIIILIIERGDLLVPMQLRENLVVIFKAAQRFIDVLHSITLNLL